MRAMPAALNDAEWKQYAKCCRAIEREFTPSPVRWEEEDMMFVMDDVGSVPR